MVNISEGDFKNIVYAFIFMSLFGMLVLGAVTQVGNSYSKDTTEVIGANISYNLNQSVSGIQASAEAMQGRFQSGSVWSVLAGVVVEGIFGIAVDMAKIMVLPFNIVTDIMINVFKIPAYVSSVLLGVIIMTIIFGVWRLIRIGE